MYENWTHSLITDQHGHEHWNCAQWVIPPPHSPVFSPVHQWWFGWESRIKSSQLSSLISLKFSSGSQNTSKINTSSSSSPGTKVFIVFTNVGDFHTWKLDHQSIANLIDCTQSLFNQNAAIGYFKTLRMIDVDLETYEAPP